jgi:serine/threonine protein kinase/WD40 repeat protein
MAEYLTLSPEEANAVDRICNRFEEALRQRQPAEIEQCLRESDPVLHPALLRELILVERAFFPERTLEHYRQRFPGENALLQALFADARAKLGAPKTEPGVTLPALMEQLQSLALLKPEQCRLLAEELAPSIAEPRALLAELVRRDWVTPFQANALGQGRGAELKLGAYLLLDRLGRGGMGQVYRAWNTRLGKLVALKLMRTDRTQHPSVRRRFQREIRAVAQLDHLHIVRALDADEVHATFFLVMELVDGINLQELVARKGPLPAAQACDYIRQAALGLQHAHERGLIHRDIKPSNLLWDQRAKVVKLLDLGLARFDAPDEDSCDLSGVSLGTAASVSSAKLTHVGTVMGTPDFMPPEQARDATQADARSDMYSLGTTLFFLLTGRPPFLARSMPEKFTLLLNTEAPPVHSLRPDVPVAVSQVVQRLLARAPEDRYPSAAALIEALDACQGAVPSLPAARAPGPSHLAKSAAPLEPNPFADLTTIETAQVVRPPGAAPRRAPALRWASGIALGVLTAFTAWWLMHTPRPVPPPAPVPAPAPKWAVLDRLRPEDIPKEQRFDWQPPELVAVLGSHERRHWGYGTRVAFHPNGTLFASGGADGYVHLWRTADGKLERSYGPFPWAADKRLQLRVDGVSIAPDGELTAVYGDGSARSWDANGNALPRYDILKDVAAVAYAHKSSKMAIAWNNHAIQVIVRVADSRQSHAKLEGHQAQITSLSFSEDDRLLASGSADATARLWDVAAGKCLSTMARPTKNPVQGVAFAPDSNTLLVTGVSEPRTWSLSDPENPVPHGTFGPDLAIFAVGYAPNGEFIVTSSEAGLRVWDARKLEAKRDILMGSVGSLAFSPDGKTLVTGCGSGAIRMWDTASWRERFPLLGTLNVAPGVSFAPDGSALAWVGHRTVAAEVSPKPDVPTVKGTYHVEPVVNIWDLRKEQSGNDRVKTFPWREGPAIFSTALPSHVAMLDGNRVVTISENGVVQYWNVKVEVIERSFGVVNGNFLAAAFSSDCTLLGAVMQADKNALQLLRVETDIPIEPEAVPLEGLDTVQATRAIAFSPDGKVLSVGGGARIRHWDLATSKQLPERKTEGDVLALAYGADGRWLAAGTVGHEFPLFDARSGVIVHKLTFPDARNIRRVAIAPDSRLLAAHDGYGRAAWWEISTSMESTTTRLLGSWKAPGFVEGYSNLAIAPDSRHLAIGNVNGTVYILRIERK